MVAIAQSSSDLVQESVRISVQQIQTFVTRIIQRTFGEILASFKVYWITLGVLIGVLLLITIIMLFVKK